MSGFSRTSHGPPEGGHYALFTSSKPLYEAIQRLEDAGYIEETDGDPHPENGQLAQRRYYRLTTEGWAVLRSEIRHLARLVDHARTRPRLRRPDLA